MLNLFKKKKKNILSKNPKNKQNAIFHAWEAKKIFLGVEKAYSGCFWTELLEVWDVTWMEGTCNLGFVFHVFKKKNRKKWVFFKKKKSIYLFTSSFKLNHASLT